MLTQESTRHIRQALTHCSPAVTTLALRTRWRCEAKVWQKVDWPSVKMKGRRCKNCRASRHTSTQHWHSPCLWQTSLCRCQSLPTCKLQIQNRQTDNTRLSTESFRKLVSSLSCPSVRTSAWNDCARSARTFVKLYSRFCEFILQSVLRQVRSLFILQSVLRQVRRLFILQSVLRQVRRLFQSEFSTVCDLVLPLSISSIFSFP
jgi:hypothetical protein